MATTVVSQIRRESRLDIHSRRRILLVGYILVCTCLAVVIHGYHPFAEDGGIYLPAIEKQVDPNLFAPSAAFADFQSHYSLFAPLVAALVRTSQLSLPTALFVIYAASIACTLYAAWCLSECCFGTLASCCGAAGLLALWLTIPVAGTSLLIMDPYVTARTLTTPACLFALSNMLKVLDRSRPMQRNSEAVWCGCMLLVAFALHPLMAGYSVAFVLLLACSAIARRGLRWTARGLLCMGGIAAAACLDTWSGPANWPYIDAAQSRQYWFLANWHWYEFAGLLGPMLVLSLVGFIRHSRALRNVLVSAFLLACSATASSVFFVHTNDRSYALARLQPLRAFHPIYVVMAVVLGAWLGEQLRSKSRWMIASLCALLALPMLYTQLRTFPSSDHLELPGMHARNQWVEAFLWIRAHIPQDAVFALDARYIEFPGEDAQNFVAVARRSSLADYCKDGGIAAIDPDLAKQWYREMSIQQNLNSASDVERLRRLKGKAQWIVIPAVASTYFQCPYRNSAAKVCKVPQ